MPLKGKLAELWFGTHVKGESKTISLKNQGVDLLSNTLSLHGRKSNLPFLLKILSIKEILSIQLHPDSTNAVRLHSENNQFYPDSSPKPEMAIALNDVKLLCGMRDKNLLMKKVFKEPAFLEIMDSNIYESSIKDIIKFLFNLEQKKLEKFYNSINKDKVSEYDKIALDAFNYLGFIDPGIVLIYLLELHEIKTGEAIFISPGVPHAYISGDLVECMLNSDNVVRGGLTSKYVDRDNFCSLIETNYYEPLLLPQNAQNGISKFAPPGCPFFIESFSEINSELKLRSGSKSEMFLINSGSGILRSDNLEINLDKGTGYLLLPDNEQYYITGKNLNFFRVVEI